MFFLKGGVGWGWGVEESYVGKVVDIKRMTKNPNPGHCYFSFLAHLSRRLRGSL